MSNQPSNRPCVANDYSFGIVYVDYPTLERIPKVGDPLLSGSRS